MLIPVGDDACLMDSGARRGRDRHDQLGPTWPGNQSHWELGLEHARTPHREQQMQRAQQRQRRVPERQLRGPRRQGAVLRVERPQRPWQGSNEVAWHTH